jgi:nucleoid-associated protein YgaU
MWMVRASLVVILLPLASGADLAWPGTREAAAAPQDALHEVMRGDNLHLIAGYYYYGDTRQWERIWEANRDQIANPNRIEPGALLRIPDAVLPDESYTDFVARALGVVAPAGAAESSTVPAKPEVEVRIAGEAPATPASPETEPTTPPGPAGPSKVVGAPGTLPPRPILPPPASRP